MQKIPRCVKSGAAILMRLRIGQGVLRSHMVMRGGRVRDSVAFSVVSDEWPDVKSELQAKLGMPD
jgi:N-acetyltransferase